MRFGHLGCFQRWKDKVGSMIVLFLTSHRISSTVFRNVAAMFLHSPSLSCLFAFITLLSLALSQTIDLQWAICDTDSATVLSKLGKAGKKPYKAHNITYYDTDPPTYTAEGLAFRTKMKHHKHPVPISMVKARFEEEIDDVPADVQCVWDRYGGETFFTCALAFPLDDDDSKRDLDILWSPDQMAFAQRYQAVDFEYLAPYGPYLNPKWKVKVAGHKGVFDDVMAFDANANMLHLMELEIEAKMEDSEEVFAEVTEFLAGAGVIVCKEPQLPKTLRLFERLFGGDEAITKQSDQRTLNPDWYAQVTRKTDLRL